MEQNKIVSNFINLGDIGLKIRPKAPTQRRSRPSIGNYLSGQSPQAHYPKATHHQPKGVTRLLLENPWVVS
jgi:hypothetical protein